MELVGYVIFISGLLLSIAQLIRSYPKRLVGLWKQASLAATEYRMAYTAQWKGQPPSLSSVPFNFMIERINRSVPKISFHMNWYDPFVIWQWRQLRSSDPDMWERVIRYATTRELIV